MTDIVERLREQYDVHTCGMLRLAAANEIERLRAGLNLIATGEPAAAGSAKPLSFKEWVRMVARTALTGAIPE